MRSGLVEAGPVVSGASGEVRGSRLDWLLLGMTPVAIRWGDVATDVDMDVAMDVVVHTDMDVDMGRGHGRGHWKRTWTCCVRD